MRRNLVTGGAGFIGCNIANRLLERGEDVTIVDNLSREGAKRNLEWLQTKYKGRLKFVMADIRNPGSIDQIVSEVEVVYHMAAQVAVTTSVQNPREDFDVNALGTFNLLEATRKNGRGIIFLYASTNKVYGVMDSVPIVESETRYRYPEHPLGISESQPLDFHSPYGCSKGAADQYVRDYGRIYGLKTVALRQSCIYGPRQFGVEDQGWVAWFLIAAVTNRPITIFGDGKQARDLLYIDDLLDLYDAVVKNIDSIKGEIFNVGGGPENVLSVWAEFGPKIEKLLGKTVPVKYDDWRPGDQRLYVSDIRKAQRLLNWYPKTSVDNGIRKLYDWIRKNVDYFK
jgi:CDP-paratose 2-epimerase